MPGYLDAMTAVALLGQVTDRIEIGTAVVPMQTRHPLILAQQALTTQVACAGRFALGVGPSHHWIIADQLGLPYDKPARLVRDYLDVLDAAFAGPGAVSVDNESFSVHSPVDVTDAFEMPVLIAALGPTMLRIAGERTAAPSCGWPTSGRSETTSSRVSPKRPDRRDAPESASLQAFPSRSARTSETDEARTYASEVLGHADFSPNYVRLLEHGDADDVGDTMAAGDEATVLARLRRYRDAGVTDLAARVVPLGDDAECAARRVGALKNSSRRWSRNSLRAHSCP